MVFKYAIRARRLVVNPCADVEKPTITPPEKQYLDHQQVQELAVASGRFRTLVLVLAYSGLRFGEAVALRRRDIDLDEARIWVTKSATHVAGEGIVENNTTKRTRASSRAAQAPTAKFRSRRRWWSCCGPNCRPTRMPWSFRAARARAHICPSGNFAGRSTRVSARCGPRLTPSASRRSRRQARRRLRNFQLSPRMSFGIPARHWRSAGGREYQSGTEPAGPQISHDDARPVWAPLPRRSGRCRPASG